MKWYDWFEENQQIRNYGDRALSHISFDEGRRNAVDRAWKFITQHFHPTSMKNDGQVNWGIDGFTEEQFRKFMNE